MEIQGNKCIVKLRLPVQYFSEDAKPEQIDSFKKLKEVASDISENGYGIIVLPALTDQDGKYLFDLEVIKV